MESYNLSLKAIENLHFFGILPTETVGKATPTIMLSFKKCGDYVWQEICIMLRSTMFNKRKILYIEIHFRDK